MLNLFFSLTTIAFMVSYYVLVIVAARPEMKIYVAFSTFMVLLISVLSYLGAYGNKKKD